MKCIEYLLYFYIMKGGTGVFISGNVTPGTILAIFPGVVHLPEYTTKKNYVESLMPDDNFFLMKRYLRVIFIFV